MRSIPSFIGLLIFVAVLYAAAYVDTTVCCGWMP